MPLTALCESRRHQTIEGHVFFGRLARKPAMQFGRDANLKFDIRGNQVSVLRTTPSGAEGYGAGQGGNEDERGEQERHRGVARLRHRHDRRKGLG